MTIRMAAIVGSLFAVAAATFLWVPQSPLVGILVVLSVLCAARLLHREPTAQRRSRVARHLDAGRCRQAMHLLRDPVENQIQYEPEDRALYLRLARCYEDHGECLKAVAVLKLILLHEPGNEALENDVSRLIERQRLVAESEERRRQLIRAEDERLRGEARGGLTKS
jgi:hypothetical protein